MEKLKEILALMKELSAEEMAELKAQLTTEETAQPVEEIKETEEVKPEAKEEVAEPVEEAKEEPKETEEATADVEIESKEEITPEVAEKEEEPVTEEAEETAEVIPPMEKNVTAVDEGSPVVADDGGELPVDYEQVIDGLNAKIAALQSENATLKSKVDSAFGYSLKPTVPTRTNRLYDEATDLHFTK